jgi:CTP:molybdopterin cytidylyltransferase MocA/xanthine/CO dehydrogenase XdhC/CoxF family maturation factor
MRKTMLEELTAARRQGRPMVRALDIATGEDILIDPATDISPLGRAAGAALRRDLSGPAMVEGRDWFLTVYNVPWELAIIGAVHIGQSLAQLAAAAGYGVRVIDPRPAYAAAERFPGFTLEREWPDDALAARPLTARSALVALAHDPKIDDPALIAALASPAFYVGALGSKRTHMRRLARVREAQVAEAALARIRGPVGLAIGARNPTEIAISILAEMVQVRRVPRTSPRLGGVVLAAGLSRRMGKNKLILNVNGKPLVRHAVEAALQGGLDPILVVTGHDAPAVEKALAGLPISFVHNENFAAGLSASLKRGIAALPHDRDGAMVLLGDMPEVSGELIASVMAEFDPAKGRGICIATAKGAHGHPVLWARKFFAEIATLTGDSGAKSLISAHRDEVCEIPAPGRAPLTDIDTPADLAALSPEPANNL